MRSVSFPFLLLVCGVAALGTTIAMLVRQKTSEVGPLPLAMSEATESQFPKEYKSYLDIGSRFPDEVYYSSPRDSGTFAQLLASGPTVLLLWTPGCESCEYQALLWDSVMEPLLLPGVREVVCLPLAYLDSADVPAVFTHNKQCIFVHDERFRSQYNFIVGPTIVAVDQQGFVAAIQYAYSPSFTAELIEAVTAYEVGPSVRVLRKRGS